MRSVAMRFVLRLIFFVLGVAKAPVGQSVSAFDDTEKNDDFLSANAL